LIEQGLERANLDAIKKTAFLEGFLLAAILDGGIMAGCLDAPAQNADQAWLKSSGVIDPRDLRALGSGALEQSAVEELKAGPWKPCFRKSDGTRRRSCCRADDSRHSPAIP
jgi:hypothetical protein